MAKTGRKFPRFFARDSANQKRPYILYLLYNIALTAFNDSFCRTVFCRTFFN